MADQPESGARPPDRRYRHLPALTWSLLALLTIYFLVWFIFYRPSTEERLEIASFAEALHQIPRDYVEPVDRATLYQAAMKGMIASLKDKYSWYLSQGQLSRLLDETKGEFGGIGVVLSATDTLPVVEEVIKDGPAAKAGVEANDVLTTLDGEDVSGLPLDKLSSLIRGKPGTTLTLGAARGSKPEKLTFTITRETIRVPDVRSEMLSDGIGLVRLTAFDENAGADMRNALTELVKNGLKGLIIDVRGNPGGLVKQATEICDLFLNSGRIISLKGRDARPEPPVDAKPGAVVPETVPIVVLVDHGTASASEILSGALQANGRATVVGTGTVGKGAVTAIMPLPDGSGVVMTVAHYELAGGEVIQGKGIKPDVVVGELPSPPKDLDPAKAREWYRNQHEKARKEQLDRAVAILKEKLAK